jgi:hypothetical protein
VSWRTRTPPEESGGPKAVFCFFCFKGKRGRGRVGVLLEIIEKQGRAFLFFRSLALCLSPPLLLSFRSDSCTR